MKSTVTVIFVPFSNWHGKATQGVTETLLIVATNSTSSGWKKIQLLLNKNVINDPRQFRQSDWFILFKFYSETHSTKRLIFKVRGKYIKFRQIRLTLTTPNPSKSSKGALFLERWQRCWKLVLSPLQIGQNFTTWQEVQAISAEYERSTKMHGAFWR